MKINSIAKLLAIALTILLAIHALPANATLQWNSESRDEATKDGRK